MTGGGHGEPPGSYSLSRGEGLTPLSAGSGSVGCPTIGKGNGVEGEQSFGQQKLTLSPGSLVHTQRVLGKGDPPPCAAQACGWGAAAERPTRSCCMTLVSPLATSKQKWSMILDLLKERTVQK